MTEDTYRPLLNGTQAELMGDKENARRWFEAAMLSAARTLASGEDLPLIEDLEAALAGEDRNRLYRLDVQAPAGVYYYDARKRSERPDWHYVLEVQAKPGTSYGRTRIKIRKDGSVNEKSLGLAVLEWAKQRVQARVRETVSAANAARYAAAGSPGEDIPGVRVSLSRKHVGIATVYFYFGDSKLVHDAAIEDVERVIAVMRETPARLEGRS